MTEPKEKLELTETSFAYLLSALAALFSFLLGWLICTVLGLCHT